eukprot:gene28605-31774_t
MVSLAHAIAGISSPPAGLERDNKAASAAAKFSREIVESGGVPQLVGLAKSPGPLLGMLKCSSVQQLVVLAKSGGGAKSGGPKSAWIVESGGVPQLVGLAKSRDPKMRIAGVLALRPMCVYGDEFTRAALVEADAIMTLAECTKDAPHRPEQKDSLLWIAGLCFDADSRKRVFGGLMAYLNSADAGGTVPPKGGGAGPEGEPQRLGRPVPVVVRPLKACRRDGGHQGAKVDDAPNTMHEDKGHEGAEADDGDEHSNWSVRRRDGHNVHSKKY